MRIQDRYFFCAKLPLCRLNGNRLAVNEINPATHNPRRDLQPDDPEYKQIEASIDGFGFVEPLVWNRRTGNLVGGHQRFKILVRKGYKEIEVSVVNLDLEKEKALNIALNKVQGTWDKEKLMYPF